MGKIAQLCDFENQNHYKTVILKFKNYYQLLIFQIKYNSKSSDFEIIFKITLNYEFLL